MAGRIKGILFDLGDTLVDFGDVDAIRSFTAGSALAHDYLRERGYRPPPLAQYNRRQLRAIRLHYFLSRITHREFNALDLIDRLNRRDGRRLSRDVLIELAWLWYKPLSETATVEDGLHEMLRSFRDQGVMLGVVSNTFIPGQVLDRHLAQVGLLELFPIRVYSCDVRFRKPDRRIFQIALRRGNLQAEQTVFVGDSPRADVRGANRAGLISVLKDPMGRYDRSSIRPAHHVRRITELAAIVDQYDSTA